MHSFLAANLRDTSAAGSEQGFILRSSDRMSTTVTHLFDKAEPVLTFEPGSVIFHEGDHGKTMYAVQEGSVNIVYKGKTINTVGKGEIFGEMALIDGNVHSASAVASTVCRVVPVDAERFQFMVQNTPYFALYVMSVLAERLRRMNEFQSLDG
jgi:CRP-like cAMP-binding protein